MVFMWGELQSILRCWKLPFMIKISFKIMFYYCWMHIELETLLVSCRPWQMIVQRSATKNLIALAGEQNFFYPGFPRCEKIFLLSRFSKMWKKIFSLDWPDTCVTNQILQKVGFHLNTYMTYGWMIRLKLMSAQFVQKSYKLSKETHHNILDQFGKRCVVRIRDVWSKFCNQM